MSAYPQGVGRMKVLITPRHEGENPYDKALVAALVQRGVRVDFPRTKSPLSLWRAVRECGKPDIIHLQRIHSSFVKSSWILSVLNTILFFVQWLTLRILGVKFVWTIHNLVNHENHKAGWELFWDRALAHIADGLIVHCDSVVQLVASTYRIAAARIRVVPQGNYLGWMPAALPRQDARVSLQLPLDRKILLFFGGVRRYKGVGQLLATFEKLDLKDTLLVIAGEPSPKSFGAQIAQQAKTNPFVILNLRQATLVNYLSACDVAVLPYVDSLTSAAIMMAATYERPIIAPRLGCMCEFPAEAGIFYDPADPNGLETAILASMSDALELRGAASRKFVDAFPWDYVAKRTIAVYESSLRH
jgi:glycosyltransferase involved in cell wall biosynthesis